LARSKTGGARRGASILALVRAHPGWSAGIALVVFSFLLILWAKTRPGFDPYGWLVWGHQTLHWNLDTNGAPSWKPLPYVFTVPFAIFGKGALWLWMVTAVSLGLSGVIFAARIAYRLTGAPPERRYAAIAAAVVAGFAVFGINDYMHYILSDQSDPIIVSLCLAAIDCHLNKRHRWAVGLLVLASLGRPEVWPFAGLYALWAFRAFPPMRLYIAGALAVIPLLWFGIPAFTADSPFVAGNLALHSPRALHHNQIFGTLERFINLHEWPLELAALVAIALAVYRRDRVTLVIAAAAVGWVLVEVAFSLHGWPAIPRYLFEPAAVMVVLAGVAVGRLLVEPPRLSSPPGLAAIGLVVLFLGSMVPAAVWDIRHERKDLFHERGRTRQIHRLQGVIAQLGGVAAIRACGQPVTEVGFQSILAWEMGLNVGKVGYRPKRNIKTGRPIVLFEPPGYGWQVRPVHTRRSQLAQCHGMRVSTPLG
jgi:hypothetical protein